VRGRRSCSSSDGEVHASRRSLVFSIAPRWMDEILVLRKTVELRRRPPRIATRVEAYLYETRPECRLRARCLMGPVISAPVQDLWDAVGHKASVTREEFDRYFSGVGLAHAINIDAVQELAPAIPLDLLRKLAAFQPPQSWCVASDGLLLLLRSRG
jgi:predicted transcriptional regulator